MASPTDHENNTNGVMNGASEAEKDSGNHSPDASHIEAQGAAHGYSDPSYVDHRETDDRADEAKGKNSDKFDRKYWLSWRYIGTLFAIGMAFMAGIGGYGLIGPVLTDINKDIGPSPNINWVPLVNLCGGAVFFMIVGQLSDIFGRRWFFIIGSVLGLIGSIVGAVAQNVNTLIGAQVFIGVAVAFQQSFFWVVAEIVPMRWRYIANSYCYLMTTPTSPLAARVAYSFQSYPGQWRNSFYFLIAINAVSIISWYAFYHPPTFSMLHRKKLATDLLKYFDWIGLILYTGGLLIFLFGINWGGTFYPWNSAPVIAMITVGGTTLFVALPVYEIWLHKKTGRDPYLPLHLFTNIRFQSAAWNTGIAALVYYAYSLIFPQVVTNLWYARGWITEYEVGTLAGLVNMAYVFAQVCHGGFVWFLGPKWTMIGAAVISTALLPAAAANLDNKALTQGLVIPGAYAMGIVESVAITTSTFPLRSQEEIGQGGGLSGSTRNFASALGVAIFTSVLANRLLTTIPQYVYPVARQHGVKAGQLEALAACLQDKGPCTSFSNSVQEAVAEPFRLAFKLAARTVFLVTIAFCGLALILACFTTNNDKSTEHYVAGAMHSGREEKDYKSHKKDAGVSQTEAPQEETHAS